MKTLILVRHGKSLWKYPVSDIERPLKKRGIADATLISSEFIKTNIRPDYVVSSPAKRAFDICKIFMNNLEISDDKLEINPTVYDFQGAKTADFIQSLDNNYQKVMLFGHNYAFTWLVNSLGSIYIDNLPTSGLVLLNFDVHSWKDVKKGTTELMLFPKHLK